MEVFYAVIKILAGCGAFLLGFKLLSDNMEKIAGNRLKSLFNKTSEKKMVAWNGRRRRPSRAPPSPRLW
ncbi:MAG: hypothetical protein ACLRSW_00360 [Christensenellaceae bacterium]